MNPFVRDNLPSSSTSPRFSAAQPDEMVETLFGGDGDQSEQEQVAALAVRQDAANGDGFSMDEGEDALASRTTSEDSDVELRKDEEQVL